MNQTEKNKPYLVDKEIAFNEVRGQVSIELAVIIGLVITLLIPALIFVTYSSYENVMSYATAQANVVVSRLANEANMVGLAGPGSSIYVIVFVPQYTESFNVTEREVILRINTYEGPSDMFRITNYQLIGNNLEKVGPGLNKFRIDAINKTHINITAC